MNERLAKREAMLAVGLDPYPISVKRNCSIREALVKFGALSKARKKITLAGRVRSLRDQGKIIFADIEDDSGRIQGVIHREVLGEDFDNVKKFMDSGDFVEITGPLFATSRGQKSIEARACRVVAKSIRPVPTEWFGLEDAETRLRHRYLDLLLNPELKEFFRKKSAFWRHTRNFLLGEDFLEVETPVLEAIPGGADARPFKTHHNALDIDLYLRISLELHLKRLLVGGFEKVFEIGRIFRNEGIDDEHLQDYTQMEFYAAYMDHEELMAMIEKMTKYVLKNTFGTLKIETKGKKIDWGKKWPRVDYFSLLSEEWGADAEKLEIGELYGLAKKRGVDVPPKLGRGRVLDYIYKKTIRPKLLDPQFLVYPPAEVEPLAKRVPGRPGRVARVQILALGTELGKGFAELNDPVDQRERFEEQMKLRAAGDEEAQRMDEDFVEALEYGMPPAAGFGWSERIFTLVAGKTVREGVFFPLMRRREGK